MIRNPWSATPAGPPYVLAEDAAGAGVYQLEKLPCPWSGPALTASVLMLMLNPGFSAEEDHRDLLDPRFLAMSRRQLNGVDPFPWLTPEWVTSGGGGYWNKRLRRLIEDLSTNPAASRARIAERFATVDLIAYSSTSWIWPRAPLPSQAFTAQVMQSAMTRGAAIIVARSWNLWISLVPEMARYPGIIRLFNPQSPYLSPGNMTPEAYALILDRLRR